MQFNRMIGSHYLKNRSPNNMKLSLMQRFSSSIAKKEDLKSSTSTNPIAVKTQDYKKMFEKLRNEYKGIVWYFSRNAVLLRLAYAAVDLKYSIERVCELEYNLSVAELAAARLEFLSLYCNKLINLENHYCVGMPTADDDFLSKFRETKGFEKFPRERIKGRKHFRMWLWILTFGDETVFTQLSSIRESLNYSPERYVWFADKAQAMFELLSDDNHSEGRMLDVKFIKKDKIKEYLCFLSPDLQAAAEIFFISEGWI